MDTTLGLIIFGELLLILAIAYGILHENALIRFEDAVIAKIRAAVRRGRMKKAQEYRRRFNERVTYTPVKPGAGANRSAGKAA